MPSVYFLEELSIPNIAFEIYWPLYTIFVIKFNSFNQICWHCALCNCWKLCQHNSLSFSNVCQKHVLLLDGWWSAKWVEINFEVKFIFIFPWYSKKRDSPLNLKSYLRLWRYISSILVLYLLCYNRFLFFEMLLNISAVNKNCVAISKRKLLKQHWKSCKKEHNKYFRIYTKHCHQITNTKFKQNMIVKLDTWQ